MSVIYAVRMKERGVIITRALHVEREPMEAVFKTLTSGLLDIYTKYKETEGWWVKEITYEIVKYECKDTGEVVYESILKKYNVDD